MVIHKLKNFPIIEDIGLAVQDFNYDHELYKFKNDKCGIEYLDFSLTPAPKDETLLEEMISATSSGDVVYDIGANVGHYTLPLAAKGCVVYSFEPHPKTYKKLRKNIRANNFDNVVHFNDGLSDTSGELTFYQSSRPARSSFNKFNARAGAEILSELSINVSTIDELVANDDVRPPSHVKVDVEGFGLEVLKGGKKTIDAHKPVIYFEPHQIEEDNFRKSELYTFFEELGYEITESDYRWVCRPTS